MSHVKSAPGQQVCRNFKTTPSLFGRTAPSVFGRTPVPSCIRVPAARFVRHGAGRGEASINRGLSPPSPATEPLIPNYKSELRGHVAFALGLAELCAVLRHGHAFAKLGTQAFACWLRGRSSTCGTPRPSRCSISSHLSLCEVCSWKVATRKVLVSSISLFSVVLLFMVSRLRYESLRHVSELGSVARVCTLRKVMKKLWKLAARRPKQRHAAAVARSRANASSLPAPGGRRRELGLRLFGALCSLQLFRPGRVSPGS